MPDFQAYLSPTSIAVVGAASNPQILRGRLMELMLAHPYAGAIYPVSRSSNEVMGRRAYRSVSDLPETVDLAILIIPSAFVPDTLRECGRAGIKAAQIISSGFAEEPGSDGSRLQAEIAAIAAEFDMAVAGPNSEGFTNTRAALAATFSPAMDCPGVSLLPDYRDGGFVSVIAQSGGIGYAFFDRGRPKELPFNYVVTTGNEAALEQMDLVDHLLDTGETDVFLLFMEDIKTPAKLARVADKALRAGKPLIVTKIGRSEAGQRAAASHTAALAGAYSGYEAMFRRYGIIEGAHIEDMVDIAAGFSQWGHLLPRGKRVGITTASGGAGGWMGDTASLAGLEVPLLDAATRTQIDALLPPYGTSQNPVDATAQAVREVGYAKLAAMVAESSEVDAVITVTSARNNHGFEREQAALTALARETAKPVVFCTYTNPHPSAMAFFNRCGIPLFTDMSSCARTVATMAEYRAHRERYLTVPEISTRPASARDEAAALLGSADAVLFEAAARPVLACYGVAPGADGTLVQSAEEAVAAAAEAGVPVVLKVQSPDITHKTDAGALALDVSGDQAVSAAFERIQSSALAYQPQARIRGVLVQPMAPAGLDMIVGITRDAAFGPLLMVGIGGIHVEVLRDVVFSPVPVSQPQAMALLDRLRGRVLLDGARGAPRADTEALAAAMVALSELAADHAGQIESIDLNPLRVHERGAGVSLLDALIVKRAST